MLGFETHREEYIYLYVRFGTLFAISNSAHPSLSSDDIPAIVGSCNSR